MGKIANAKRRKFFQELAQASKQKLIGKGGTPETTRELTPAQDKQRPGREHRETRTRGAEKSAPHVILAARCCMEKGNLPESFRICIDCPSKKTLDLDLETC